MGVENRFGWGPCVLAQVRWIWRCWKACCVGVAQGGGDLFPQQWQGRCLMLSSSELLLTSLLSSIENSVAHEHVETWNNVIQQFSEDPLLCLCGLKCRWPNSFIIINLNQEKFKLDIKRNVPIWKISKVIKENAWDLFSGPLYGKNLDCAY